MSRSEAIGLEEADCSNNPVISMEDSLTASSKVNSRVPVFKSSEKLVNMGGVSSGKYCLACKALPSVIARTSVPPISSIANACIVR